MALTKLERDTTIKSSVLFTSGSIAVDPSGNMAFLDVYKPDGTLLIDGVSGSRDSTGAYHYFFNTQATDLLGIYVIDWWGRFYYGLPYDYKEKHEKEVIWLVNVAQT